MNNALRFLILLLTVFSCLYFYKLGSIGLIDVDEPRYAEVGREILESGNWIVPYFNYEVRFDKPILFNWLEAISMTLFGINEFASRLPSALSAFLCLYFVFCLVKRFYSVQAALIGVLVLMSSFEFASLARFSITDMTLSGLFASSIISFFLGYDELIKSHRFFKLQLSEFSYWYILGFIFLGLAFLTKGPVVILLTLLILVPFFWWIGKLDYFIKSPSFWIGFLTFLCLVLPWYIAVHITTLGEFTKAFFGFHNISRFTSVVSGHKGSVFYFIPVILIGFLPWTFFLPQAVGLILKTGLKSLLGSTKEQLPWFCLWWFIVIFLFFSFSKTKLLTYILPLFPALSLIITIWLDGILKDGTGKTGLVTGLGIFFLFCLALCCVCLFKLDLLLPREVSNLKLDFQIVFFVFLMLVGISMAWASSHKDVFMTVSIILFTFLFLYFGLVSCVLPKVDRHSQLLLRTFALTMPKDVEIATYEIIKPSLTFYAKRQIKKISSFKTLQDKLTCENKFAFVTKKKLLSRLKLTNAYKWGEDGKYVFYTNYKD